MSELILAAIVAGAVAGTIVGAAVIAASLIVTSRRRPAQPPVWRSVMHKSDAPSASPTFRGGSPFSRFNDRAKRVLALAQDEAIRFNHNYIGTEHLLLALVREGEGVAARVLDSLDVELSKVRSAA